MRNWSLVLLVVAMAALPAAAPESASGVIYSAELDSIIHPASAEYMVHTIDRADAEGAALVVFTLKTPGGLVDSTREIVTRMISAKTPVVVYVAPSGARAASAGFILTLAADVAVMAPGTHIGAAHPVAGGGEKMDETTSKKAAEDVAAYVRTIAAKRHRNVELAEQAVLQSKAFTEEEALGAEPPLIDLVAPDLPALLEQLDGRLIRRFDGREATLHTRAVTVVPIQMTLRQRILSAIAHPNLAYILLSLGTLGLTIELWSPGAVLPGVVGALSLLLAFFALQVLPVNYVGLLLMLFGVLLFILEVKVTSFGLLTAGGVLSLLFGSMMLFDSPAPELQLNLGLIVSVVLGFSLIAVFLIRLGVRAQRTAPVTGIEGLLNERGEVLTDIAAGGSGRVRTHGEIWSAIAEEPLLPGDRVRIVGVDGLTLSVRKE